MIFMIGFLVLHNSLLPALLFSSPIIVRSLIRLHSNSTIATKIYERKSSIYRLCTKFLFAQTFEVKTGHH